MIRILDKYIIRQFLQTIVFGILAFTVIFVVVDMMENLDDFIDNNVSYDFVLEYYIVFIPEIIRLMLPIAVLLSCLFTVGKMSNLSELTAIKSSGVSFYRIMAPFLVTAFLISIFSIYFGGYVVPGANKRKVYIEQNYMKKGIERAGGNIYFQDSENRIVNIFLYDTNMEQANRVSIQEFDPKEPTKMIKRTEAEKMKFDSSTSAWILTKGIKREFIGLHERVKNFSIDTLKDLNFSPIDVIKKQTKPEEMTLKEMKDFSAEQLRTGNNPTRILIEYHSRIAFAFSSFIVVFFGLPLSANKRKGGIAIQFGISILITFIYLVFMKVSQAFGKNGVLDPLITAWFANGVFALAAVATILRIRK